jgi:hypothetical protein
MFSYVNYILFCGGQYTPRYSLGAAPQNACLFSPLSSSGTYSRKIQSYFCSFVISLSCSQINHFRACSRLIPLYRLLICASPSTCPAKDTGRNIRAGQFQDMLGIEEGIKRRKEREEAIHPPDHKSHDRRENCRREIALLFSKQETAPDLKKEMLNKKRKTEEHNFRKISQKEKHF